MHLSITEQEKNLAQFQGKYRGFISAQFRVTVIVLAPFPELS